MLCGGVRILDFKSQHIKSGKAPLDELYWNAESVATAEELAEPLKQTKNVRLKKKKTFHSIHDAVGCCNSSAMDYKCCFDAFKRVVE